MKVVILAGGLGTRLSKFTKTIPKPMVKIGNIPIILHIINIYSNFGHKDFFIAAGYQKEIIHKFFNKFKTNCNIKIINTGKDSMTGGRILKLKKYIGNERFLLTYGDGVSTVNIKKLIQFHIRQQKIITVTAVRPPARFGELTINGCLVSKFKEKTQMNKGWINGGFFVVEPTFFNFLKNKNTILEKEPLEKMAELNQLSAFKHDGFWACMDTNRDKDNLHKLVKEKKAPWIQ